MAEQINNEKQKVSLIGKILVGFIILSTVFAIYLFVKLFIIAQSTH